MTINISGKVDHREVVIFKMGENLVEAGARREERIKIYRDLLAITEKNENKKMRKVIEEYFNQQ